MKKTFLPLLLFFVFNITIGQNVSLQWAKSVGSSTTDIANSIAVDASGNAYITGTFQNTADFDPGAGTMNITSQGVDDIFVIKLNSSGNLVWAKTIGGINTDFGLSVFVGPTGNLYLTGGFRNTVDFDPNSGITNLTSLGTSDAFVLCLSNSGSFVWVKQMGGSGSDATGFSIKIDGSGNIYTCGTFKGTVDFDPNAGVSNLTSTGIGGAFISKLDNSGNLVWAKKLSGSGITRANCIQIDASSNVLLTGDFDGTTDFDPNGPTYNFTAAWGGDTFILKLDASGNFVWAKQMAGNAYARGNGITTNAANDVYTVGWYLGTVDYNPGPGTFTLSSLGATFISKLDASGNFVWAKHFSKNGAANTPCGGYSIGLDPLDNVYLTGYFRDTVDFDPGPGTYSIVSLNPSIYVSKLDLSGNFVWAKKMDASTSIPGITTAGNSLAIYNTDNIYIAGNFQGTVDFDPSSATYPINSSGEIDAFMVKLCQNGPPQPTITTSGSTNLCPGNSVILTSSSPTNNLWSNGATSQSISVNTAGNYYVTVSNTNGCSAQSSIITVTVLPAPLFVYSTNSMVVSFTNTTSGCSTFLWDFGNGNTSSINPNPIVTYATPGVYNPCLQCNGSLCVSCLTITVPSSGSGGIGITELPLQTSAFQISPNPNNGLISVEILDDNFTITSCSVKLFDISNREIKSFKLQNKKQEFKIDDISNGIYYLKLYQDLKCLVTKKIIKQ